MNKIDSVFKDLRAHGKNAFIPFVTAGDPDLETTCRAIVELAKRGSSVIEIGIPYSDPIADGGVIQASYTRALGKKIRIDEIFAAIRRLENDPDFAKANTPLVAMVSYSLVHRRGPQKFIADAQAAGLSGAIVPDLPLEEAAKLADLAATANFKLIQLVTPTTPRERAREIARLSTGFLYCVSVVGITGERHEIPKELRQELTWLREQTSIPLCVGFGVSQPEHAATLKEFADGVIVGSAIVRRLQRAADSPVDAVVKDVGEFASSLIRALEP